ncbi:cysteine-rich CWC family protein [Polaromonas sp.]|uniref:cysteine-rich CWC family protein n=1 Tax=Polaromonas sp. TaxID=1869339 RepID=UPI0013B87DB8|nr:cysteine-rich CWC family protein [Polaromonas sp.]NDP62841.1 cysteine-rich CWC family protein [Polaromonas sp.]
MASTELKANTSICPRCSAGLRCGMVAGDAECWCVQLPHVMPVPPALPEQALPESGAAFCFCPACLKQITDEQQHPLSTSVD